MEEYSYEEIAKFESMNWWYQARRDLLFKILKKTGRKFSNILDIGCGVGSHCAVLKQFGDSVIGVDPAEAAISFSADKGYDRLVQASVEQLPFPDASFELILCADVLEHVDDTKAIQELNRLLRPGGQLLITVPAHPALWNRNDVYGHHRRRYTRRALESLLRVSTEFRFRIQYWNCFAFFPMWVFAKWEKRKLASKALTNNLSHIPRWLNGALLAWMSIENRLSVNAQLPLGVTLIAMVEKTV